MRTVLVVLYLVVATPCFAQTKGDVNNDGRIDVGDLVLSSRHVQGTVTLDPVQFDAADVFPLDLELGNPGSVQGDGMVDLRDLLMLQQTIIKKTEAFQGNVLLGKKL